MIYFFFNFTSFLAYFYTHANKILNYFSSTTPNLFDLIYWIQRHKTHFG